VDARPVGWLASEDALASLEKAGVEDQQLRRALAE
jgi:hypothetical protein